MSTEEDEASKTKIFGNPLTPMGPLPPPRPSPVYVTKAEFNELTRRMLTLEKGLNNAEERVTRGETKFLGKDLKTRAQFQTLLEQNKIVKSLLGKLLQKTEQIRSYLSLGDDGSSDEEDTET